MNGGKHKYLIDAQLYAEQVVAGTIPTNLLIRLACERHIRDLHDAHARGLYFDESAAEHALRFFTFLRHSKGEWAGQEFILQPWQCFIVASLFGWMREDGTRRFRTAYVEIPRKNGKSTLAAGIGLYLAFADGEPGAEVYSAATKRDQARIVHGEAIRMVRKSPDLLSRVAVFRDNLNSPSTESKFEPLGADEDTLDGLNVHGAIIDEVHAHKTRGVWDVLDTATGSRRQPLIFAITTAGYDRTSVCWELHTHADNILSQVTEDDSFYCFVAGLDKGDDWTNPACWAKANPNWNVSVKPSDIQDKCERAKKTPSGQNAFRRLRLNEWTEQYERYFDMRAWDACGGIVNLDELVGKPCWGGLDLSSTRDLTACSLLFEVNQELLVVPYFWMPEDNIPARVEVSRQPYHRWAREGLIEATEGNVVDYDIVEDTIVRLSEMFDIQELAYDKWNATQIALRLKRRGVKVVPARQTYDAMAEAMKMLDVLIEQKKLKHSGNRVLRWMASNTSARTDGKGNFVPDKEKSNDKIDGITATVMALAAKTLRENDEEFIYRSTGIFSG